MKRTISQGLTAIILYIFIRPVLSGILCAAIECTEMTGNVISCAVALLLMLVKIKEKNDQTEYAICKGRYHGMRKYIMPVLILPLLNVPYFFIDESNAGGTVLYSVFLGIYVGIMEELIFRAFIFRLFELKNGEQNAVIWSSVAFGLMHILNLGSVPVYFTVLQLFYAGAIGLVFGVIRAKTGSILIPVVIHSMIDAVAFITDGYDLILDTVSAVILFIFGGVYYISYLREKTESTAT